MASTEISMNLIEFIEFEYTAFRTVSSIDRFTMVTNRIACHCIALAGVRSQWVMTACHLHWRKWRPAIMCQINICIQLHSINFIFHCGSRFVRITTHFWSSALGRREKIHYLAELSKAASIRYSANVNNFHCLALLFRRGDAVRVSRCRQKFAAHWRSLAIFVRWVHQS